MKRFLVGLLLLGGAAPASGLLAIPAQAQVTVDIGFSDAERRIINDYFGGSSKAGKAMPPGLAKKGGLPPGLAKKGKLPPGIAKRDLPGDLLGRLPAARPGTARYIVDNDVVLIAAATGIVLDILGDVAQGR
ncbi:MAG: RcnB family protein [Alphaproteobacteria bacterium]|nr:RcnB family protein [Alphaproteobacteria bacterium]MBU0798074.1 RcnB family protein [Alphaproteobacteria bacterium]MBU0888774.1 RcnB family protein [Alphaproteobacteria bacterium]MBU1812507.1 RcnB family protein [Alphaproteobacteria bacterium]MBU2091618.1 RcnB family protein [Alphaproteobacteria bacterium]